MCRGLFCFLIAWPIDLRSFLRPSISLLISLMSATNLTSLSSWRFRVTSTSSLCQSDSWKEICTIKLYSVCVFVCVCENHFMYCFEHYNTLFDLMNIYLLTQSKSKTQITRSVHWKFNCISVKYNGTQHIIYVILLVH